LGRARIPTKALEMPSDVIQRYEKPGEEELTEMLERYWDLFEEF
jgi:hypothetical protein